MIHSLWLVVARGGRALVPDLNRRLFDDWFGFVAVADGASRH